jgi:hypothetical protein
MFCRAITILVFSIGVTSATLVLAGTDTTNQSATSQAESKASVIPRDAARAIRRAEVCHFLAGELGGDNSKRDKEVNDALKRNRCSSVAAELRRLKIKYQNQAQVLASIEAAE